MPDAVSQYILGVGVMDATNTVTAESSGNIFMFETLPGNINMQI